MAVLEWPWAIYEGDNTSSSERDLWFFYGPFENIQYYNDNSVVLVRVIIGSFLFFWQKYNW